MLERIRVKAGLIALLSLMAMLLIMVSIIGANAIKGPLRFPQLRHKDWPTADAESRKQR